MTQNHTVDVMIVGGGVVGLTCALALAKHELTIGLLEKMPFLLEKSTSTQTAIRVSAITPTTVKIFQAVGIWSTIQKLGVSAFTEIIAWENEKTAIHFRSADIGEPVLGYIIENQAMHQALFEQINKKQIMFMAPATVEAILVTENDAFIRLDDGRQMTARLVIGADGGQSRVRALAGMDCLKASYAQHALIATVQTREPHCGIARQCFLPTGPLAFLPLRDPRQCSIVWSHQPVEAEALAALPDDKFNQALQTAFGDVLGEINVSSARNTFPLYRHHVEQYSKSRIALIGDAAHALHPLAGQGINLGLLDAVALADAVHQAMQKQRDIGAIKSLRAYQRARKGHNAMMLTAVNAFHALFHEQPLAITMLRHLGMRFVDRCQPLKNKCMQHALGFTTELPDFIRQTVMND